MIKKTLIFIIIITLSLVSNACAENEDYIELINESVEYIEKNNGPSIDEYNYAEKIVYFAENAKYTAINQLKDLLSVYGIILLICSISSILSISINSETISELSAFGCYIMCAFIFAYEFRVISKSGIIAINDLCDYMNIAFPGYASLLASSGYGATATTMHMIFASASNVIAYVLNNLIVPVTYSCGLLTFSNGISNIPEIDNIIKQIIKLMKYIIGVILTIFSAIIGFTGLTATTTDGILIKTAKYAVSNFVPIVGACLSDTLNSVIYTSQIMKNTVGIIGITAIIAICLIPVVKIFVVSFSARMLSYFISMLQNESLAKTIETISDILSFIGAMLLFISVVFIIMIGTIASVGA